MSVTCGTSFTPDVPPLQGSSENGRVPGAHAPGYFIAPLRGSGAHALVKEMARAEQGKGGHTAWLREHESTNSREPRNNPDLGLQWLE